MIKKKEGAEQGKKEWGAYEEQPIVLSKVVRVGLYQKEVFE